MISSEENAKKFFCFTVDDNIRFLKEITETKPKSIFDHPYLDLYRRLHREFDLKVQLNLFYRLQEYDLSQMSGEYREEWESNAHWLKLSFHSDHRKSWPYAASGYEELFRDCKRVNDQIVRFASHSSLAKTTTIHCCRATKEGLAALSDLRVKGLLGLFGTRENPRMSYGIEEEKAELLRRGAMIRKGDLSFFAIDIVLNCFSKEEILRQLEELAYRQQINVMIHEQHYYADYKAYQPDFEEKLRAAFDWLRTGGYESAFLEECL